MAAVEELAYLSNQLAFEREAPRTWSKADFMHFVPHDVLRLSAMPYSLGSYCAGGHCA